MLSVRIDFIPADFAVLSSEKNRAKLHKNFWHPENRLVILSDVSDVRARAYYYPA